MGILDAIEGLEGQPGQPGPNTNAKVAGGVMQALDEHPGGLAGILDEFRHNGMNEPVQQWSTGQQATASPQQIQQGLGNSGFIDRVAAKAGVSPETAQVAMATVLPLVIAHFTKGGQQAPPQSGFGGMAEQVLGKFL